MDVRVLNIELVEFCLITLVEVVPLPLLLKKKTLDLSFYSEAEYIYIT